MPKSQAKLEAVLFQYGEPMPTEKIMKLLELNQEEFEKLLAESNKNLENNPERGLILIKKEDRVQLVTKPEFHSLIQKLVQEEFREELTQTAIETLAIVAYLSPIPKSLIDYIRGVNSNFTLRSLLIRGLIERRAEVKKGNVYHYEASFDFLKHMGIEQIKELPEYEKYKNILKDFELSS